MFKIGHGEVVFIALDGGINLGLYIAVLLCLSAVVLFLLFVEELVYDLIGSGLVFPLNSHEGDSWAQFGLHVFDGQFEMVPLFELP